MRRDLHRVATAQLSHVNNSIASFHRCEFKSHQVHNSTLCKRSHGQCNVTPHTPVSAIASITMAPEPNSTSRPIGAKKRPRTEGGKKIHLQEYSNLKGRLAATAEKNNTCSIHKVRCHFSQQQNLRLGSLELEPRSNLGGCISPLSNPSQRIYSACFWPIEPAFWHICISTQIWILNSKRERKREKKRKAKKRPRLSPVPQLETRGDVTAWDTYP